ncbi:putative metal tolerance protein C3 [Forsythia ovata]|uniref:Metal tolerance protein C3 n=1 Tax=Forsythia ovata TaxID=205694 RepID=A0ABD1R3Z6_9LAMI
MEWEKDLMKPLNNGNSDDHDLINGVSRIRCDFIKRLPDKLKSRLDDDPEDLLNNLNLSSAKSLLQGEKEYYERQFATLRSFEEVDSLDSHNVIDEELDHQEQAQHERAMNISNWANVFLLAFKIYATVQSGSLAIAASTLDSLLDLMAGGILMVYPLVDEKYKHLQISYWEIKSATSRHYRLCCCHGNSWFSEALETRLFEPMQRTIIFDVVTNVVGLIAAVLGNKFYWWIDPAGAIILAFYTISNWSGTVLENAVSLVGQSAPPEVLQKLTYLVLRHSPQIKRVDTVRAYTFGVLYFVEVDIELPEDLPLKEAHAIGETLQIKIEELPEVERAFVHLDYECDHKPEHTILSKLPNTEP